MTFSETKSVEKVVSTIYKYRYTDAPKLVTLLRNITSTVNTAFSHDCFNSQEGTAVGESPMHYLQLHIFTKLQTSVATTISFLFVFVVWYWYFHCSLFSFRAYLSNKKKIFIISMWCVCTNRCSLVKWWWFVIVILK